MEITSLEESGLDITRQQLGSVFEPFVSRHVQADDPEWRGQLAARKKKILPKYLKQQLLGWLPARQRNERLIVEEYSDVWQDTNYSNYSLEMAPPKYSPWEWGDDKMLASAFGGTRLRQSILASVIRELQPRRVLEVGCGNGINLLMLAGCFPETQFAGVELTRMGNQTALGFQEQKEFPEQMRSYAPFPFLDDTAYKRIQFLRGSAAELPFAGGEFDLVYTVLALEQMERIRDQALSEVARVAGKHTLMIEPFRDVNACGWTRANVVRRNYFCGRVRDLPRYGLTPVRATSDFPQEVFLKACAVLSEKQN